MKYEDILGIDSIDKEIIKMLQDKPELTHQELSKALHVDQSVIGNRIIQLKEKKITCNVMGTNFDPKDMKLARIDIATADSDGLMERLHDCPYISNFYKMTGDYNITIEIAAPNQEIIENFTSDCMKNDPNVSDMRTYFITDMSRTHLVHLNPAMGQYKGNKCTVECGAKSADETTSTLHIEE